MKVVSRFEDQLLRVLYCFLRRVPLEQVRSLAENRSDIDAPPCLSRGCVELVEQALARGTTAVLAGAVGWQRLGALHGDGWRHERFLRGEHPVQGRLWERTLPADLALRFSRHTVDFLLWITAARPADPRTAWQAPPAEELALGDLLLLFLAYEALRPTTINLTLRSRPPFSYHGLCRLAFPSDFALNAENPRPDFLPWTAGAGAYALEAFQRGLAKRWAEVERSKANITDWQQLLALGQCQEQTLHSFLDAVEAAERPDLARFLLRALAEVLRESAHARDWVGGLRNTGPRMSDRAETHRAALAVVRQLERLRRWEQQARRVGYFDEGYARSQLWLADWEHYDGARLYQRALDLVQELNPLRQPRPAPSSSSPIGNRQPLQEN